MQYLDLLLEASDAERRLVDKSWQVSYRLRVIESPAGAHAPDIATTVSYASAELVQRLSMLEKRSLDRSGMIDLGRILATLLLPTGKDRNSVYDLFMRSMDQLKPDQGLRLRLRLPPLLAVLPWEYIYIDRSGETDSIDGFLALHPRLAIVREEAQPMPSTLAPLEGPIKIVAAFATPEGLPSLDLKQEQANLHAALDNQQGLSPTYLEQATLDELLSAIQGAAVFHFAGHGQFVRMPGDAPGSYTGKAGLAFFDQYVDAEQLAVNLSQGSLRLALLGGCETARRDEVSVWSGIAPTLVRAQTQIPAVIANQYSIIDACAIAFSKHFYQALVAGLSIEEAVSIGRIAAYNADPYGRDWGVPVLYLRPGAGQLFTGASDTNVREQARAAARVNVNMRANSIAKGGFLKGAKVRLLRANRLNIEIAIGEMRGSALGAELGTVQGGQADINVSVDKIKGAGQVTGAEIDEI